MTAKWSARDVKLVELYGELVYLKALSYYRAMRLARDGGVARSLHAIRKKLYLEVKKLRAMGA